METSSSSLDSIQETRSAGVVGNPYLAGGYLIGSSLLGLLIIIWAFWYHSSNLSLFQRACAMSFFRLGNSLMGVQVVHSSLVSLLTIDALNMIMAIIYGATLVTSSCGINCFHIHMMWFMSRWFGVIIHLLNASLSISHLCHQPLRGTRVRIVHILIGVLIGIIIPLQLYVPGVGIFTLAAFMFLFALAVIVKSTASTSSPSTATLKKRIVVIAMCNFLVVYVPTFIVQCLIVSSHNNDDFVNYAIIIANVLVFTNLHLIFDGLQCALVLKLPSGEEQQQELQQW